MWGYIEWSNKTGMYYIRVEGFSEMGYMFYTKKEAIARYRAQFGLQRRKIHWVDRGMVNPTTAVEDALKYLESLSEGGRKDD